MWSEREIRVLGLMAGSSMDGIDLAICRFLPDIGYAIERAETVPVPEAWQERLRQFPGLDYKEGFLLDVSFGVYLGELIRDWLSGDVVDLIGVHGYTVIHEPEQMVSKQLGIGRAVYHTTGIPVVDGFRNEDVLGGGSGAPLAPVVERDLFPDTAYFINLGGILNASVHGADGEVWARDLTGCNQVANALAAVAGLEMDRDGQLSEGGTPIPELLEKARWLCRDTLEGVSISNDWVRGRLMPLFMDQQYTLTDRLVTLYHHQAEMLREFFMAFRAQARGKSVLVTGGGAWNPNLLDIVGRELTSLGLDVQNSDPMLIDFKESLLIAWMAYLNLLKIPLGAWVWTGASRDHVAGTAYGIW